MAKLTKRLMNKAMGSSDPGKEGMRRTLKGLREADNRELAFGLALAALSYLQRTAPRKELLYRKTIPEGSTLVIRNTPRGSKKLQIIPPEETEPVL